MTPRNVDAENITGFEIESRLRSGHSYQRLPLPTRRLAAGSRDGGKNFLLGSSKGCWFLSKLPASPRHPVKLDSQRNDSVGVLDIRVIRANVLQTKISSAPPVVHGWRERNGVPVSIADSLLEPKQRMKTGFSAKINARSLLQKEAHRGQYNLVPSVHSVLCCVGGKGDNVADLCISSACEHAPMAVQIPPFFGVIVVSLGFARAVELSTSALLGCFFLVVVIARRR